MDAITYLETDHRQMRKHIERFKEAHEAGRTDDAVEAAASLAELVTIHSRVEEELFYPAVQDQAPDAGDLVAEGIEEHHVVALLLDEAVSLDPSDDQWAAKVTVVCENIEHHADEEEQEMFPDVREELDAAVLDELGVQIEQRSRELALEAHTVEELRAVAREHDVSGASSMNKADLVDALSAQSA